jgi:photosystem II stability/assembly factor-like uncharacterized protein
MMAKAQLLSLLLSCLCFLVARCSAETTEATVVGQLTKTKAKSAKWFDIAVSATGEKAVAIQGEEYRSIYFSNDYSQTWYRLSSPPENVAYYSVACNVDCSIIFVSALPKGLYYSHDSGASWVNGTDALDGSQLVELAVSGSGQYVQIAGYDSGPFHSSDYGETFTVSTSFQGAGREWAGIACSFECDVVAIVASQSTNGKALYCPIILVYV